METRTWKELEKMRAADPRDADLEALGDIRDATVNQRLPQKERLEDFIRQIGNPYCCRYGRYVVKVRFSDSGADLEERLLSYLGAKWGQGGCRKEAPEGAYE